MADRHIGGAAGFDGERHADQFGALGIGIFPDSDTGDGWLSDVDVLFNMSLNRGNYAKPEGDIYFDDMQQEFDFLHATRYRGETTGAGLAWLHRPAAILEGRTVLLVDDILDEGHTLKAVRDWCEDQGAARVRIAAMAVKQHERCVSGLEADYSGFTVPDRYVFGYGMDVRGAWRNLPAIHALK